MNKSFVFVAAVALGAALVALGLTQNPLEAQQQQQWPTVRIACLDVNEVFKQYEKYKTLTEGLKTDIADKEAELHQLEEAVRAKMEAIRNLKSQEDRDRNERDIQNLKFDFEKKRRDYQEEFVRREADIYSTVYKEVSDLVEVYAKQNGIHMVVRLREVGDGENPREVLQTLQRQVVYHHPNLDITEVIATGLNQKFAAQQSGTIKK